MEEMKLDPRFARFVSIKIKWDDRFICESDLGI